MDRLIYILDTNAISDYIKQFEPTTTHIKQAIRDEHTLYLCQPVTAQAEKRSVIKGEMTVGGKWVDIRRGNFHVNERLTSA